MRITKKPVLALAVGASLLVAAPVVVATDGGNGYGNYDNSRDRGRNLQVVGLTDGGTRLIRFREDRPDKVRDLGRTTGLSGDVRLVGIDYRVQDGTLYGVGNAGGIYTLDDRARATKVRQLTVGLQGSSFGVDFNPAANALRITSDTGQNLRQPFATSPAATVSDGPLTNPATPPATGTVPATGVTGAAYTNNDLDPNTATTLFDVDSALDQVSIQSPANAGSLAATGKLGVDTDATIGSDIYSTIRNGTTVDLRALASLTVGGQSRFYRVDLLQGRATLRGTFPSKYKVTGIAIPLNQL